MSKFISLAIFSYKLFNHELNPFLEQVSLIKIQPAIRETGQNSSTDEPGPFSLQHVSFFKRISHIHLHLWLFCSFYWREQNLTRTAPGILYNGQNQCSVTAFCVPDISENLYFQLAFPFIPVQAKISEDNACLRLSAKKIIKGDTY